MKDRKRRLLVIEDDRLLCRAVRDRLASDGLEVLTAHDAAAGLAACNAGAFDVVVLDQKLPDGDGHSLCHPILQLHPAAKIVFVTAYPSFDNAVQALKAGAHDYLSKPFELDELGHAVERCLSTIRLERVERREAYRSDREREGAVLVGGEGLAAARELVELASRSESPVLVTGETGTGKNLAAKAIHFGGPRRDGPFVSLNCAALPENLIEAELFGWERGAFTGAAAAREGLVEMADGGTLFLDEIGEMPLHLQSKLLALLEDKEVRRLGARTARPIDLRTVAATNADLEGRMAAGRFRADLYYRLDVIRVRLPPLRERLADLPLICGHLLARMAGRGPTPRLAPGELERLAYYRWPGNVRELRNVLDRSFVLHRDLLRPSELLAPAPSEQVRAPADAPILPLEEVEREHVVRAVRHHAGNLARSARSLGISLSTLKRMLKRYGLDRVNLALAGSE
jgi:DNA-binding NtrC family response regulator